jgi:hypothetical protein
MLTPATISAHSFAAADFYQGLMCIRVRVPHAGNERRLRNSIKLVHAQFCRHCKHAVAAQFGHLHFYLNCLCGRSGITGHWRGVAGFSL